MSLTDEPLKCANSPKNRHKTISLKGMETGFAGHKKKGRIKQFVYSILAISLLLLSAPGFAVVPEQVNFQGSLVDGSGQQVTGSVNFDFAIFDALSGGVQLWTETQTGVSVVDGIYTVALGSITPITATILSGGSVYLEITVNGETLIPRERLLAVPYALRAQEAENVGGISNIFVQQIFKHGDHDGGSPANDDPLEGFIDTDGDGLANFIDSDNDNDGILDDTEVNNGTGVNLVTPRIFTITGPISGLPDEAIVGVPNLFTVTGSSFLSGFSVQVGPENPVPQNLTSSSFEMTVGVGQVAGPQAVTVTIPNAEIATASILFRNERKKVFLSSVAHLGALNETTANADAFCTTTAANAGLSGSFVAWYSDPRNSSSAKDRLQAFEVWELLDGTVVASSLADLTDGSIDVAINVDENGTQETNSFAVATNTLSSGDFDPDSCFGSNPTKGRNGRSAETNSLWTWTSLATFNCAISLRYYCFEQ